MAFGDFEPEDAWQADDPVADQIRNLARRIALVDGDRRPPATAAGLDEIDRRIRDAYDRPISPRNIVRLGLLLDDVGTVRARL